MAAYVKGKDGKPVRVKIYDVARHKTTEQYVSRKTANGERVIEGSKAELLSVEGATVKSKNLFDYTKLFSGKGYGNSAYTLNEDGSVSIKYRASADARCFDAFYLRAGIYTMSAYVKADTTMDNYGCYMFSIREVTDINSTPQTRGDIIYPNKAETVSLNYQRIFRVITIPKDGWYTTQIQMMGVSDTDIVAWACTFKDFQIEPGDTLTEYQPYFTGLKNASFKGIKSTGRNLINIDIIPTESWSGKLIREGYNITNKGVYAGFFSNVSVRKLFPYVKAGKEYTFSCTIYRSDDFVLGGASCGITIQGLTKFLIPAQSNGYVSRTVVFEESELDRTVYFYGGGENTGTVTWANLTCNEGKTAFPFEPYTEDTLELPEAIDCGLGTTIDFENQKIVEKGVTIVLTGSEDWSVGNGYNYSGKYYSAMWASLLSNKENRTSGIATDGLIKTDAYADGLWWLGVNGRAIYILAAERYFGFTQFADPNNPTAEERATLLAEWKAYLAQRYADGNPVTIRYVSSTVQAETPFTDAQKAAGNTYKVWNNGTETIEQGEADNSVHGAIPTVTQRYAGYNIVKGEITK